MFLYLDILGYFWMGFSPSQVFWGGLDYYIFFSSRLSFPKKSDGGQPYSRVLNRLKKKWINNVSKYTKCKQKKIIIHMAKDTPSGERYNSSFLHHLRWYTWLCGFYTAFGLFIADFLCSWCFMYWWERKICSSIICCCSSVVSLL